MFDKSRSPSNSDRSYEDDHYALSPKESLQFSGF